MLGLPGMRVAGGTDEVLRNIVGEQSPRPAQGAVGTLSGAQPAWVAGRPRRPAPTTYGLAREPHHLLAGCATSVADTGAVRSILREGGWVTVAGSRCPAHPGSPAGRGQHHEGAGQSRMRRVCFLRWAMGIALGAGILTVGLSALAPASGASTSGTTASWAEQPQSPPDYIFPFMSLAFFSVANVNQFQYLMYRPLYWFGQGSTPNLNASLSLAQAPRYSANDQTVVIKLNSYRWSNGEQVTSPDVMFWMNMLHAEKANWQAYTPGGDAIPDNIQSITINSPTQLTFQLTRSFNPTWYTYNELSQITPLPLAWDKTTSGGVAGSGGCSVGAYGTVDTQCAAVYTYLSQQAGYNPNDPNASNTAVSTYATNPLWQVVDGPWRLTSFDASGNVTLVPNPSYSGPVKPTLKTFKELPFTSDYSEFNALVGGKVSVGYLPSQGITAATSNPLVAGPNNSQLPNFTLAPLYTWSINYFPYNFDSDGDNGGTVGKIFNQLYFRQAMQDLVNQPGLIARLNDGYGVPTYGPVPTVPRNSFASSAAKSNPYPYSPSRAIRLLTSHGWRVVPRGTTTCAAGHGRRRVRGGHPDGSQAGLPPPVCGGIVDPPEHHGGREVQLGAGRYQRRPVVGLVHVRHRRRHTVLRRVRLAAREHRCGMELRPVLLPNRRADVPDRCRVELGRLLELPGRRPHRRDHAHPDDADQLPEFHEQRSPGRLPARVRHPDDRDHPGALGGHPPKRHVADHAGELALERLTGA